MDKQDQEDQSKSNREIGSEQLKGKNARSVAKVTAKEQFKMNQEKKKQSQQVSKKTPWEVKQEQLSVFLESTPVTVFMTMITLWALFGDDIRILSAPPSADEGFWIVNLIVMVLFGTELVLLSISTPGYFFGFFFWLDLVSTVSLIFDIGYFNIFGNSGTGTNESAIKLARASKASVAGAKAGRIIRIVRLVRLVKIYKHAQQAIQKQAEKLKQLEEMNEAVQQEEEIEHPALEVSKKTHLQKGVSKVMGEIHTEHAFENKFADQNDQKQDTMRNVQNSKVEHSKSTDITGKQNVSPGHVKDTEAQDNQGETQNRDDQGDNTQEENKKKNLPNKLPALDSKPMTKVDEPEEKPYSSGLDKYQNDPLLAPENTKRAEDTSSKRQISGMQQNLNQNSGDNIPGSVRRGSVKIQRQSTHQLSKAGSCRVNEQGQVVKDLGNQEEEVYQESNVGKMLANKMTQKTIMIVLSMLFCVIVFAEETYLTEVQSYSTGLQAQHNLYTFFQDTDGEDGGEAIVQKFFEDYVAHHKDQSHNLLKLEFEGDMFDCCKEYPNALIPDYDNNNPADLRNDEVEYQTYSVGDEIIAAATIEVTSDVHLSAILSICRTIFISIVLAVSSMLFTQDAEELVLNPLDKMLQIVKRLIKDPLAATEIEEKNQFINDELSKKGDLKQIERLKEEEKFETFILSKLIIRLASLLSLGFGEAGAQIIAKNMESEGGIDPMIPGRKVLAIYGFCDIRNFTDATEVLQHGVMTFVNEIAEITHSTVDALQGQPNKNIGDAFLLVWKYHDDFYKRNQDNELFLKDNDQVKNYSDFSIISFVKIQAALFLSRKLFKYRSVKGLNDRMPNYTVRMGFGLHQGWGIEGAIGSEFKIDASYLSPNVNMASRLEAATKQFGTGILITGELHENFTPQTQANCRLIDKVCVVGSIIPMTLYTTDGNLESCKNKVKGRDRFDQSYLTKTLKQKKKILDRIKRNNQKEMCFKGTYNPFTMWSSDPELIGMRAPFNANYKQFYGTFAQGMKLYMAGDWKKAKECFETTQDMVKGHKDGPSDVLMENMKALGVEGEAPKDWQGWRTLYEK